MIEQVLKNEMLDWLLSNKHIIIISFVDFSWLSIQFDLRCCVYGGTIEFVQFVK